MKFLRNSALLLALLPWLLYQPAHSQFTTVRKNGVLATTPDNPFFDMRVYGATPGQSLVVNSDGFVVGGAGAGGGLTSFTVGNISPFFSAGLGGSPTTAPALTFTILPQSANCFFAGPVSGAAASPTCRTIGASDIPALPYAPTPTLSVLPLVDLHFNETAGTVFHDSSGNSNNCTIASGSPVLSAAGATFNSGDGCDLPAAVNPALTYCFAWKLPVLPQNTNYNGIYYMAVESATNPGSNVGTNLMLNYFGVQVNNPVADIFAPGVWRGGAGTPTATGVPYGGPNTTCWTLGTPGTSLDHIYVNGIERDNYAQQGANGGLQTGDHISIGASEASGWVGTGLPGVQLYEATFFSAALTASQIAQVHQTFVANMTLRGQSLTPPLNVLTNPQLIYLGDSITECYNLTNPANCWGLSLPGQMVNQPTYAVQNWGISGITALALEGSEPFRVGQLCQSAQGPSVVTLWEGTNDLHNQNSTEQDAFQNILGALGKLTAAGCRVLVAPVLSRTNASSTPYANFDEARDAVNNLILTQSKLGGAFGIADIAAVPCLGMDGAYANPTTACFQSDGTHPTDLAQPYISQTFANSLNYYFGTTAGAPYIVSGTGFVTSWARFTDATNCTSPCALTLPDATGPTGETYTIVTGSNGATVQGISIYGYTQTVNGSSGAVTLPANATTRLQIVRNPPTTGGVRWLM